MTIHHASLRGTVLALLLGLAVVQVPTESKSAPPAKSAEKLAARIHFKDGGSKNIYELKPEHDGAKLVGADEKEIARFNKSGDKLKIKGPDDAVIAYIVRHDSKYKVKDAEQKKELFTLSEQADGDWTVENADHERIYRIKKRDYGYEVESPKKESLAKVKLKEGKLSLRNAKDETTLSTKDPGSRAGMACLALEQISSLPIRMGLLVQMTMDSQP